MKNCRLLNVAIISLAASGCLSKSESGSPDESSNLPPSSQNSAPQISGSPPIAVLAGDAYNFTPSASDEDGDAISFSISNKPTWATFDSSTGALTGQPLLGDVGVYENITITVSDGTASTNLPAFSIQVSQIALGSMTLSWTAPTQNEDGSALTDLAGFKIYFGTDSGNYSQQVTIENASISTFVVENLMPDAYFVVATAFNAAGVESRYSGEVVKTVESL
jgi:hypothetical protein